MSQLIAEYVTHPPETNGGTVTSYLPVFTPFPAVPGCTSAIIVTTYTAYNLFPDYGQYANTSMTCLPQAATLSWQWETDTHQYINPATITSLGPLACPQLYTTASTSIMNSLTTFVACCPSSFTYVTTSKYGYIGECRSIVTSGQVYTYMSKYGNGNNVWFYNTTTAAVPNYMYGFALNGVTFAPTTTTSLSSSAASTSGSDGVQAKSGATSSVTSTADSPGPTTIIISGPTSGGLSMGAKIGIGVGVSLSVIGLISVFIAMFLFRRSKKTRWHEEGVPQESNAFVRPELPVTENFRYSQQKPVLSQRTSVNTAITRVASPRLEQTVWEDPLVVPDPTREADSVHRDSVHRDSTQLDSVHEMSGTLKVPFETTERPDSRQDSRQA